MVEKCAGNYPGLSGKATPQDDSRPKITEDLIPERCSCPSGYFLLVLSFPVAEGFYRDFFTGTKLNLG
jgi:hypothetical protein